MKWILHHRHKNNSQQKYCCKWGWHGAASAVVIDAATGAWSSLDQNSINATLEKQQ